MRFNSVLASRFKGLPLIGQVVDEHRRRILLVYELPNSVFEDPDVVGVFDGVDAWIANKKHSLHGLKPVQAPPARRVLLGSKAVETPIQPKRRKVLV